MGVFVYFSGDGELVVIDDVVWWVDDDGVVDGGIFGIEWFLYV